jgi:hypothetical protein
MPEIEISYDSKKAGRLILVWAFPFSSILIFLFYFLWNHKISFAEELNILQANLFISISIFIISVVLHEALHALAYLIFDKWQFQYLSFGFSKESYSPYCHYSKKVLLWKYKLALLLPGLLLGLIPIILSFIFGNFYLLIYGIVFSLGAFGDFLVLWKLKKIDSGKYVKDHPSMMGCIVEGD